MIRLRLTKRLFAYKEFLKAYSEDFPLKSSSLLYQMEIKIATTLGSPAHPGTPPTYTNLTYEATPVCSQEENNEYILGDVHIQGNSKSYYFFRSRAAFIFWPL